MGVDTSKTGEKSSQPLQTTATENSPMKQDEMDRPGKTQVSDDDKKPSQPDTAAAK